MIYQCQKYFNMMIINPQPDGFDIRSDHIVDFLPVLSPPNIIEERIRKDKRRAANVIGKYAGLGGRSHITMRDNLMHKNAMQIEEQILAWRYRLAAFFPIDLYTDGINYFSNNTGGTIYEALQHNPLVNLWFSELMKIINNKKSSFVPHITIAKQISHKSIDKLYPEFNGEREVIKFRIDRLTVLRRKTYDLESYYEIFREFKFKNELFTEKVAMKHYPEKYLFRCLPKQEQLKLFKD